MKKLSLDVEDLMVDSFDTFGAEALIGYGESWSDGSVCPTVSGRCCPP